MSAPTLLPDVERHFKDLAENPEKKIDADLLDKFELQITENIDGSIVQILVLKIAQLILTVRNDASPLASLGSKLVKFSRLTFSDLATLDSNLDLNAGLNIPSKQINSLVIAIIGKAAERASEAAVVAGKPELVASLVNLWLRNEDTLLASKAQAVLVSLLEVDQEDYLKHGTASDTPAAPPGGSGSGLMWRRLFGDKVIYEMFYSNCTLANAGQPGQLRAREKSISQGRLMDFIRAVGELNWAAVSESHLPDIESKYHVQNGGLLEFVACHMVEVADALAYLTLIAFFTELLTMPLENRSHSPAIASAALNFSSPALEFLISKNLHAKTISYYLEPTAHNQVDLRFLSGPSTRYLVTYLSTYPRHLLERSSTLIPRIIERLQKAFNISTNTWGQQEYPRNSLEVLASLPRVLLIQDDITSNPLLMLPTKPWNAGIFTCLGTLFHGPLSTTITYPPPSTVPSPTPSHPDPTSPSSEAAAARVLYHLYATRRPDLWTHIIAAASAVSLPETALAAVSLISSVLTADWSPLPTESASSPATRYALPTESHLQRLGLLPAESETKSLSGVWAILQPPALSPVVSYLFQAPKVFDKGSGALDDGSSSYSVAVAKYDALVKFHERLKELKEPEFEEVLEAVERRVRAGPWPRGVVPGERVEAMEM